MLQVDTTYRVQGVPSAATDSVNAFQSTARDSVRHRRPIDWATRRRDSILSHRVERINFADSIEYRRYSEDTVSFATMFGAQAKRTLVEHPNPTFSPYQQSPADYITAGFTLLIFIIYGILIARYRSGILQMMKILKSTHYIEKFMFDNNQLFRIISRFTTVLGILALFVAGYAAYTHAKHWQLDPTWGDARLIVLATIAAVALLWKIYRSILLKIIAVVTERRTFVAAVKLFNSMFFAIFIILGIPLLLLTVYAREPWFTALVGIDGTLTFLFILIYLINIKKMFSEKKISFFELILYLCGVEILPLSFIVILIFRH